MSELASNFFRRWKSENVKAVSFDAKAGEAEALADRLLADARAAGISKAELEAAAGEDLVSAMVTALDDSETDQVRMAARDKG